MPERRLIMHKITLYLMSKPEIAQKSPYVMELKAGTYWWCACGKSQNQPFCDGSHKGSGIAPVKTELDADKKVALCGCKHTQGVPFCDGSHRSL
jgi:CDGSH-type Zn-finger protein